MNWFKQRRIEKKALRVCDGVIEIAANEMLVQGTYVSDEVLDSKLKEQGAICGGRKACLIGSEYLAHGDMPTRDQAKETYGGHGVWGGIFNPGRERDEYINGRPALMLAYDAINLSAFQIMESEQWEIEDEFEAYYDEDDGYVTPTMPLDVHVLDTPEEGWGEFFFEKVLKHEDYARVREEVIRVAQMAKYLIRNRMVVA